jgi:hypothetical protein
MDQSKALQALKVPELKAKCKEVSCHLLVIRGGSQLTRKAENTKLFETLQS